MNSQIAIILPQGPNADISGDSLFISEQPETLFLRRLPKTGHTIQIPSGSLQVPAILAQEVFAGISINLYLLLINILTIFLFYA